MNGRAPFPVRDAEASAMPDPDEHLLFAVLEVERAVQEGRLADAWIGAAQWPRLAANAGRPLTDDEQRVLSRVTSTAARASRGAW